MQEPHSHHTVDLCVSQGRPMCGARDLDAVGDGCEFNVESSNIFFVLFFFKVFISQSATFCSDISL